MCHPDNYRSSYERATCSRSAPSYTDLARIGLFQIHVWRGPGSPRSFSPGSTTRSNDCGGASDDDRNPGSAPGGGEGYGCSGNAGGTSETGGGFEKSVDVNARGGEGRGRATGGVGNGRSNSHYQSISTT